MGDAGDRRRPAAQKSPDELDMLQRTFDRVCIWCSIPRYGKRVLSGSVDVFGFADDPRRRMIDRTPTRRGAEPARYMLTWPRRRLSGPFFLHSLLPTGTISANGRFLACLDPKCPLGITWRASPIPGVKSEVALASSLRRGHFFSNDTRSLLGWPMIQTEDN